MPHVKHWNINSCACRTLFDIAGKKKKIATLEQKTHASDFWQDHASAGRVLQEMEPLKREVETFERVRAAIEELKELCAIASAPEEEKDLAKHLAESEKEIAAMEAQALLGGKYDRGDAIVTIHAGAGGVDAQDWAEMLLRMYLRWAELKNFRAEILDESRGGEAGMKSVMIEIRGAWVYGFLRGEAGVHRLVRLSPFNADNLRQTSFALVEVLPVLTDPSESEVRTQDIIFDTFRASGAGGQHVNRTESAVRITHVPTGIVVTCQNERSQAQNREHAMKVLRAKLFQRRMEERESEKQKIRGARTDAAWGNQIRSYVLHPYRLVKDHRTGHETSDTEGVLGGDIAAFIDAYLHWHAQKK